MLIQTEKLNLAPEHDARDSAQKISHYATNLALIEVSIGAMIHGFKLPLGGHILSINQGIILTHASKYFKNISGSAAMSISMISAVLKSLSPVGNKLGPMLSISMQGFLFALGQYLLGARALGIVLSMSLLAVWAFVQPLLMLYLFFGQSLIKTFDFFSEKLSPYLGHQLALGYLLLGLVVGKCILASILGVYFFRQKTSTVSYFEHAPSWAAQNIALEQSQARNKASIFFLAFKDMCRPFFITSFALVMLFLCFTQSSYATIIWLGLRPLALAFLFFYISRHPFLHQWIQNARKNPRHTVFFKTFDQTIQNIRQKKS